MVSHLTLTTRTESSPVAFTQIYRNGVPTLSQPRPGARTPGTTVTVEDLFQNVPHRLRTYAKRESDEYSKILTVVQHYAIRYPHCGFCLERKHPQRGTLVDVNTSQIPLVQGLVEKKRKNEPLSPDELVSATKAVMAHVLEPNMEPHILYFEASVPPNEKEFTYQAHVFCTSPTFSAKKSQFIFFLNNRLVDLPPLKRSLEDVYAPLAAKSNTILVVTVQVPGSQVDVNVHPSKRQVALMYQEELCTALASKLKETLDQVGQTFVSQAVAPAVVKNPYASKKRKSPEDSSSEPAEKSTPLPPKRTPPSQLVRTSKAAPVGAIEPFLVATQSKTALQTTPESPATATATEPTSPPTTSSPSNTTHKSDCPVAKLDLTQPGAFAIQCTCTPSSSSFSTLATSTTTTIPTVLVKKPVIRPQRVTPTTCSYTSISSLRRRVNKHLDTDLVKDLRDAYFVGVISPFRSLIQCGERLVMMHHGEFAKEMFYQLALARFGGATMASLGGSDMAIDIPAIIAQAMQLEDDLLLLSKHVTKEQLDALEAQHHLLEASDTNQSMAQQATACLVDHADMLQEYFSIRIETTPDGQVLLKGLPVLLDGHCPEPHGLAIFLLRLATRVDWTEERTCFQDICRELGNFYALLPTEPKELESYIRHTLFPAISYLLLPPERLRKEGFFTDMTKLSTLYKVFERC
jgi:DNA mismatch repair protein MLH1